MKHQSFFLSLLAFFALSAGTASAGLINVNFTHTTASSVGNDGTGPVGGGGWNRIQSTEFANSTDLLDNTGAVTRVEITGSLSGTISERTQANGNPVQNESWNGVDANAVVIVTVTGLVRGQIYKVVVYSDRVGSGGGTDNFSVNDQVKVITNPGAAATTLPGTEGVDYLSFNVAATSTGELTITGHTLAGIQIQGRIANSESGSRMDAVSSRSRGTLTGKGDGRYRKNGRENKDTIRVKTGNKAEILYPVAQNDGTQIDYCYFRMFYSNRALKGNVRDLSTQANVTAETRTNDYRFELDQDEARQFRVKAKPTRKGFKSIRIRFCVEPSTREADSSDCAAYLLVPK